MARYLGLICRFHEMIFVGTICKATVATNLVKIQDFEIFQTKQSRFVCKLRDNTDILHLIQLKYKRFNNLCWNSIG